MFGQFGSFSVHQGKWFLPFPSFWATQPALLAPRVQPTARFQELRESQAGGEFGVEKGICLADCHRFFGSIVILCRA